MSSADPSGVARIELRPQRIRATEWLLIAELAVLVGFTVRTFLRLRARGAELPSHLWVMMLVTTSSFWPILWRVSRRRRAPATIEVGPDVALLPRLWTPRKLRRVPLAEIRSIHHKSTGRFRAIGIGVSSGTAIAIRELEFVEPDGAAQLEAALRAAIAARPGGELQLAEIDRRTQLSRLLTASAPWTCLTLIAVTVAVFALEFHLGSSDPVAARNLMLRLGANVAPLVQAGEWWRLVSANVLHGSLMHVSMNALGFAICGLLFERWIGWSNTLLIALAGGLGGTLASAFVTQPGISIGASTMVMGLYVGWIAVTVRYRERLPHRVPTWALVFIGVALVLGEFALPNIDHAGHVGGAVAGTATALLLARDPDPLSLRRPLRGARIALAFLSVVYALGIAEAVRYAWSWDDARRLDADRRMLASASAHGVNDAAWDIATLAAASPDLLALADERLTAVVAPPGSEDAFVDTRATLAFRRGDLPRAVALESAALRLADDRFHASQLARFQWAHARALSAPLRIGGGPERVHFQLDATRPDEPGSRLVVAEFGARPASAVVVDALAIRDEAPIAHLRLAVGPDAQAVIRLVGDATSFEQLTGDVRFETTLIDGENVEMSGDRWEWELWPLDPSVAALP